MDKMTVKLNGPTPKVVQEYLDTPYPLQADQGQFYQENRFITLKGVIEPPVLEYIRAIVTQAVDIRTKDDHRRFEEKSLYEQALKQCGFLSFEHPAVKDIVFSKRLALIAKELMAVDAVRLWHDQALFKEAGGRPTPVHQDGSYWPVSEPISTTTIWLALNEVPQEKGCLYFYPRSHKAGIEYVDIFKNPHTPELLSGMEKVYTPLSPGDATFHSGLTWHGTEGNNTAELRSGMTVIYIKDGMRYDASDSRNADHTSCESLKDGELIDTKYTPILS